MKTIEMNRWVFCVTMLMANSATVNVRAFSPFYLQQQHRHPRRPSLAIPRATTTATDNTAEDRQRRQRSTSNKKTKKTVVHPPEDDYNDLIMSTTPPSYRTKRRSSYSSLEKGPPKKTPSDQFFPQHAMMQHDILTKAQEMELGRQVKLAQQLQAKMQEFVVFVEQSQQQVVSQQQIVSQQSQSPPSQHTEWSEASDMVTPTTTTARLQSQLLSSSSSSNRKKKKSTVVRWNDQIDYSSWSEDDIVHQLGVPGGREELRRTLRQGAMARQTLITSNVRLVVSIAKQWYRRGGAGSGTLSSVATSSSTTSQSSSSSSSPSSTTTTADYCWSRPSLDEVVQEGILGLVKAVERYDITYELRFGTYATHWITSFIRRCFQEHATGCLRVPHHYHQVVQHYKQSVKRHYQLHNTAPTLDVVAQELHVSPRRLQSILACTRPLISLDAPRKRSAMANGKAGSDAKSKMEEDADVLINSLPCTEPRPEEQVEFSLLRQCLEHAMSTELSPHERDVVRLRLGLDDGVARTIRQVALLLYGGDTMHMADIRAAEQRALKKLRSPYSLHTQKLLRYLDPAEVMNYQF